MSQRSVSFAPQQKDLIVLNDVHRVFAVDALASSHPLSAKEEDIQRPEQISELFDAISYSKVASHSLPSTKFSLHEFEWFTLWGLRLCPTLISCIFLTSVNPGYVLYSCPIELLDCLNDLIDLSQCCWNAVRSPEHVTWLCRSSGSFCSEDAVGFPHWGSLRHGTQGKHLIEEHDK